MRLNLETGRKNKLIGKPLVICLVLVGSCFGVEAERPAGMVLFFKSGEEVFLLLADHREKDRGWAGYGGGPYDGESPAETAARETEEETRGYFLRDDLLAMIKDQEPVIDDGGFALFFAEVPFVPAQLVTNNPLPNGNESYVERGPYAWIPYSELEPCLKSPVEPEERPPIEKRFLPRERHTSWYWPVWLSSVRRAVETNSIPWDEAVSPDLSENGSHDP